MIELLMACVVASQLSSTLPAAADASPAAIAEWTVLLLAAVDNSAEESFMGDLATLRSAMADDTGVQVVLLIDRSPKFNDDATVLGEEFADTRLYQVTHAAAIRLDGTPELPQITRDSRFEANTGDATLVHQFLRFGKRSFPARHYALVFYTHGGGASLAPDNGSDDDEIWTGELSAALTEADSVDLLGFDVCSMGGVEDAYEWRRRPGAFGADVMVASAPATAPWPYHRIFGRLRKPGTPVQDLVALREMVDPTQPKLRGALDPATLSALDFGRLIVGELELHREWAAKKRGGTVFMHESWASYDLSTVADLKLAIDDLAVELAEGESKSLVDSKDAVELIRGSNADHATMRYFDGALQGWLAEPYFDVYELACHIAGADDLGQRVHDAANLVAENADAVVDCSFGRQQYPGFEPGHHGLYITFPDGDAKLFPSGRHWQRLQWLNANRVGDGKRGGFGCYAFCRDRANPGDGLVQNWFELLDAWFDEDNGESGGVNGYRY